MDVNDKDENGEAGDVGVRLVYATCPSVEVAEKIGSDLVERHLAACVNILPGMTSIYVWQGKRCRDTEAVLIIKTTAALADVVVAEMLRQHPFDNPAIVVLPVAGGSKLFLDWIAEQTNRGFYTPCRG